MKLKQIEDDVLHLPEEERAELAQKLLLSLVLRHRSSGCWLQRLMAGLPERLRYHS